MKTLILTILLGFGSFAFANDSRVCFDRVMDGRLYWGGGYNWAEKNARKLCRGTSKAGAPIRCFRQLIPGCTLDWGGGCKWNWKNAVNLCQGTSRAQQPLRCFRYAMSGRLWWGNGYDWKWKNAIKLCQGTNDWNQTVNCFERKIDRGVHWTRAIERCQQ